MHLDIFISEKLRTFKWKGHSVLLFFYLFFISFSFDFVIYIFFFWSKSSLYCPAFHPVFFTYSAFFATPREKIFIQFFKRYEHEWVGKVSFCCFCWERHWCGCCCCCCCFIWLWLCFLLSTLIAKIRWTKKDSISLNIVRFLWSLNLWLLRE